MTSTLNRRNLKHKGPLDLPKDYALSVAEQGLEPNGRSCAGSYKYDQDSTIDPFGPDCPELNIVIQIVGSRGDVQPYLSLAIELILLAGHQVRIATHGDFREFVLETGRRILRRRWAAMVRCGHEKVNGRTLQDGERLSSKLQFFASGGSPKDLMAYMVKSESSGSVATAGRLTQLYVLTRSWTDARVRVSDER